MKRLVDIILSAVLILIIFPLGIIIFIWVMVDAGPPVFFTQQRVGKNGELFNLYKFRSMYVQSEKSGQLTVGKNDKRITRSGQLLRKYKIDELPQLWNVLIGDMSLVGPRPEVPKYVAMYSREQKKVLSVKPGITDHASLLYFQEGELLAKSTNPERTYIDEILPAKLKLNLEYIEKQSIAGDLLIIWKTVIRIFQ